MALFVTGIGALIHLYAIGYMHGDPKFSKFFLYLNLFVFSMLMLVLGDEPARHVPRLGGRRRLLVLPDLVLAHPDHARPRPARRRSSPTASATVGFMIAMFLAFQAVGSLNYAVLNGAAPGGAGRSRRPTAIAAAAVRRRGRQVAPSCRCTSGCPTPWKARRRSRP